MDCTSTHTKVTVKVLIDPKSFHGSISKTLAKKMDLYIFREYGSRYSVVRDLGIDTTNASKKVMRRGWIDKEEVSVTLPNIFDEIVPSSYFGKDTANFVVVDKSEYDLVLGSVWLMHTGYAVDRHQNPPCYINKPKEIEEQEREKSQYHCRKNLWELPLSLHTFYELLFPEFIATNSDGEVILTKFFKHFHIYMKRNLDLSKYYDLVYTETESECSSSEDESEDEEVAYNNNVTPPIIMGMADTLNNFVTVFNDYLRQADGAQNIISAFLSRELIQPSMEWWYSTDLTNPEW